MAPWVVSTTSPCASVQQWWWLASMAKAPTVALKMPKNRWTGAVLGLFETGVLDVAKRLQKECSSCDAVLVLQYSRGSLHYYGAHSQRSVHTVEPGELVCNVHVRSGLYCRVCCSFVLRLQCEKNPVCVSTSGLLQTDGTVLWQKNKALLSVHQLGDDMR